jgi:hypothetical protein
MFETSEHSFHGVTAVKCPPEITRNSFAIYCYTQQAPSGRDARSHSTIFKARPNELVKRHVLMPAEQLERRIGEGVHVARRLVKRLLGRH